MTVLTENTTVNDTSVDIKCSAIGIPSKFVIKFWRQTWPGTNLIIRDKINPSEKILTILHPSYQDMGVYTCFVENGVSAWGPDTKMVNGSVYLLVECKYNLNNLFCLCVGRLVGPLRQYFNLYRVIS